MVVVRGLCGGGGLCGGVVWRGGGVVWGVVGGLWGGCVVVVRGLCGGVVWGRGVVWRGGGGLCGGLFGGRGLRTPHRFIFHFSRINILLLKLFYYCSTMAPISMSPKIESQITCAYCARLVRGLCGYLQNSVMYWPYTSRIAGYINICMVI